MVKVMVTDMALGIPYGHGHGHCLGHGKPTGMVMVMAQVILHGHGPSHDLGLGNCHHPCCFWCRNCVLLLFMVLFLVLLFMLVFSRGLFDNIW